MEVRDNKEKSRLLYNSFFPTPSALAEPEQGSRYLWPKFQIEEVTDSQIHWAIWKLSPYKAPGPSGISNAILTHCWDDLVPHLGHIYCATFELETYPMEWQRSATIALRKPSKPDYGLAKGYRPIALVDTLAKTLSACVAETLVHQAEKHALLPPTHFGGRPGQSTTNALHLLTKFVKDAWRKGNMVTVLFLDVKGAFPSVSTERLLYNMQQRGVPKKYMDWLWRKLKGCHTTIGFDDFQSDPFDILDGCDQVCPLSCILYIFYNSDLLDVAKIDQGELSEGFIDDITYLAMGKTLNDMHRQITDMMTCKGGGLLWFMFHNSEFEDNKLRAVDFTRHREKHPMKRKHTWPIRHPPFVIGNLTITPSPSHKCLGVILDQELHFREHAAYTLAKGTDWVMKFHRLSKPSSGMPAKFARWLFNGIAVPRMLYAADIVCTPILKQPGSKQTSGSVGFTTKMAQIQRMATLHATGAMCMTATDVLDTHADILPFQLLLNKVCHRAAICLATLPGPHPLNTHVHRAARYVRKNRSPLHDLLHAFEIKLKEFKKIQPIRKGPWWEPEFEVRMVGTKGGGWEGGSE
jgi:hypothetical protein